MKKVFENNNIGNLELQNRLVRSGTWMRKANQDGSLTEALISEYEKLAKAQLGLVICGYARVNEIERANDNMIGMYDDKFIPKLQEFTSMFHDNNTLVGIQIAMGGTQFSYEEGLNWDIMCPSEAVVNYKDKDGNEITVNVPEMTKEQIVTVQEDFVQAARRVKESGFDMVELHAGHGYFLSQWLNPKLNRREDEYGIDKTKFIVDLYKAVRSEVGNDFTIGIKLNSEETIGDHSNHQLMLELCEKLDELGIDLIEVSGTAPSRMKIRTVDNESYFQDFAKLLSNKIEASVMLTGGNKTFSNFDNLLNEVDIDLVGLSRPLISEPDLISKWRETPEYKPRCISCNYCHRNVYTCVFDK